MEERFERKTDRGLLFSLVGVLTLVVAIIGATYAYFAAADNDTETITGTAATAGLDLTITPKLPTDKTKQLIPQKSAAINNAIKASCVDANRNGICQLYELKIKNTGNAQIKVDGKITFTTPTTNLKWAMSSTADSGFSTTGTAATTTAQAIESAVTITGGTTHTIYIAVWIHETGEQQNDAGTFTASVNYTSSDGNGVTSTITS